MRLLLRFDYVARLIIDANLSIMWPSPMPCVSDCVADCIRSRVLRADREG